MNKYLHFYLFKLIRMLILWLLIVSEMTLTSIRYFTHNIKQHNLVIFIY